MTTITGKGAPKFTRMSEGEHTLKILAMSAIPKAKPTCVQMRAVNEEGVALGTEKYPYQFDLNTDGGYAAFYHFMDKGYDIRLDEGEQIDLDDLIDTFVEVNIVHKLGSNGTTVFVNIGETVGPGEPFDVEDSNEESAGKGKWDQ